MDTTVNTTVAFIVRCLEYVTGKQDIATVNWGGNQIHVTRVRLKSVKTLSISYLIIKKRRKQHRIFNINLINVTFFDCLFISLRHYNSPILLTNNEIYTYFLCECSSPPKINFFTSILSYPFT